MSKKLEPLHLSESKIKELRTQYKQERDRRMAERIHCIILYAQGKDLNELKRILFVGIKTLEKWIKTYLVQGLDGLRQWGYKGQTSDLSVSQWAEVEAKLERQPYRTLKKWWPLLRKSST